MQTKASTESGAESPTTARPLEMDDDEVQETGVLSGDAPPPKPPRPVSEAQKNQSILKEAFPTVDDGVIRAVLSASGGQVEPAFNALLEMTDPDAVKNEPQEVPPPQPPRPNQRQMSQLEADELYARQLAEHYDNVGAYEARTSNRGAGARPRGQPRTQLEEERERSFLDDDFPVIKENLRQGFIETQTKVNGWISTLKKKIEENFDESEDPSHKDGPPYRNQGQPSRRSNDYDRYDADPQVLSDDFAGMKFTADGTPAYGNRPMANTGIYRPPPSTSPRPSGDGRRVGFKDEPEEINMYDTSPKQPPRDAAPSAGGRASKWQPLSSVDPNPITDNDPFSLGDSEDEREVKEKPKSDDADRLKQATSEAMSEELVGSSKDGKKS
ncbi:CUE domain-containing protein 5 [Cladobotryum mycophilum]|uniref:CUE domain-containing protein 5 n=1 Tax=Cladobotryum mycophilum TaxID=491253 RepID=A0ABR0T1B2_9HYPO